MMRLGNYTISIKKKCVTTSYSFRHNGRFEEQTFKGYEKEYSYKGLRAEELTQLNDELIKYVIQFK